MSEQVDGVAVQVNGGKSVSEAAEALGISERTVRRRIKAGELRAFQMPTSQGYEWRVQLDGVSEQLDGAPDKATDPQEPTEIRHSKSLGNGAGKVDSTAVQVDGMPDPDLQRALDLADQFQRQNVELAARVGYLQAKLEAAEQKILALAPPVMDQEPKRPPAPWWRRLLGIELA